MPVIVTPVFEEQRLAVVGDVQASLLIPVEAPREADGESWSDAYYLAFSDGTLVMAYHEEQPTFHVMVEGAGQVAIDERTGSFGIDWDIEWITVASNCSAMALGSKKPSSLPFFETISAAA